MLERENISYAELSREDYINVMREGVSMEPEALMAAAKKRDFETLGPAVVMRLRQQAQTACRLLLQMEREGIASGQSMEECLGVMPASLKRFMRAYFGWGEAGPGEMQACQFLRETFLSCAQHQQLKRYAKLVHQYPDLLLESAGIFLQDGQYDLAMEMYQAVPDRQISERDRCHAVGSCAYQCGKFETAKENLRRAMELGDESPEISIFLQWIEESEAKHK